MMSIRSLRSLIVPLAVAALSVASYPVPGDCESLTTELATLDPIPASLSGILNADTAAWRTPSAEVYRWDSFPDILILDLRDFPVQDRMFSRLAYFTEKRGFKGKLLTNAQLAGRHGWNAHDYGPTALAEFFSAASASGFPLNAEELALRRLAIVQGLIAERGGAYTGGSGGVLSLTRASSVIERKYLLTHESFHGIFFSSDAYRDYCFELWDSLPTGERSFYTMFLDSLGYDGEDHYLAVNEFQAYLMQQPLSYAMSYFERFIKRFAEDKNAATIAPQSLLGSARSLDAFLRSSYGISAGENL
jgi:hypothetical protein